MATAIEIPLNAIAPEKPFLPEVPVERPTAEGSQEKLIEAEVEELTPDASKELPVTEVQKIEENTPVEAEPTNTHAEDDVFTEKTEDELDSEVDSSAPAEKEDEKLLETTSVAAKDADAKDEVAQAEEVELVAATKPPIAEVGEIPAESVE